jgi:hypothetical protein
VVLAEKVVNGERAHHLRSGCAMTGLCSSAHWAWLATSVP